MTNNNQDSSNLKSLLSPRRAGTFFAPFRFRSANPDGFDSKMKIWISAIEEWAVINRKLIFNIKDIHMTFISDNGTKPDKECLRLVFSEMKRKTKLIQLTTLKSSNFWPSSSSSSRSSILNSSHSSSSTLPYLDNYIDSKGWLSWGVKNFLYNPATWAMSTLTNRDDQTYSDLTDMSITDSMKFISTKSLNELSQNLSNELIRIAKAEKQFCFEWQHLLELISPILNTIIEASDSKELTEMLDLLIDYLAANNHIALLEDDGTKLVKIADPTSDDNVTITKKDIATARLLKAKELLTSDADRYHSQAQRAKLNALESYNRKELAKAKSLMRSHKRLTTFAEQKEAQLTNVEIMLDQLENTESNMMILQAYKDGADALKVANTNLESNTSILDEVYDVTAEAHQINEEMNLMLKDISVISQGNLNNSDLEAELESYMNATNDKDKTINQNDTLTSEQNIEHDPRESEEMLHDLERKLENLIVPQHDPNDSKKESVPTASKAT